MQEPISAPTDSSQSPSKEIPPGNTPPRFFDWLPGWIIPAWIPWEFVRFGMVGTLAFVIDASLLRLLLLVGFGFYSGRAVSFLVVATGTWILNRSFTFRGNIGRGKLRGEWAGYLGLMALGGAVNYGVYALAIENSALIRQHPELGVALGALAGMMINYWSARTWFRRNGQPGGKTSGRP